MSKRERFVVNHYIRTAPVVPGDAPIEKPCAACASLFLAITRATKYCATCGPIQKQKAVARNLARTKRRRQIEAAQRRMGR